MAISATPVTLVNSSAGIDQTTPGVTDSVTIATAQGAGAAIGATNGAAVVTDANGTIQQYLRGLVKLVAAQIGVVASPVALATATHSNVASANADTALLAANTARKPGSSIANDSTAVLYIKLGTGASASSYMAALDPKNGNGVPGIFNVPDGWTGAVNGFWSAVNGSARVTEVT